VIIYLVSAPGHEQTGYGDGLIEGRHPHLLVSYLEYMDRKLKPLEGFEHSGKMIRKRAVLQQPCTSTSPA
jgi:hypothetical protein